MRAAGLEDKLGLFMVMRSAVRIVFPMNMFTVRNHLAECSTALRTGREDFLAASRKTADVFLSLLPETGVPEW